MDGGMELEETGLREEDMASVDGELTDLRLGELHLFAFFAFEEPLYDVIQYGLLHHSFHCRRHIGISENGWKRSNKFTPKLEKTNKINKEKRRLNQQNLNKHKLSSYLNNNRKLDKLSNCV